MSATDEKDGKRMVGTRVSPDMHNRIRVAAAEQDQSIAEFLRDLLEESDDV